VRRGVPGVLGELPARPAVHIRQPARAGASGPAVAVRPARTGPRSG
jgi:hypothetical protein